MESRPPRWRLRLLLLMSLMLWCTRMGMLHKMPPAFARFEWLWRCLPRYQLLELLRFHGPRALPVSCQMHHYRCPAMCIGSINIDKDPQD
jgi:hypothetical protein